MILGIPRLSAIVPALLAAGILIAPGCRGETGPAGPAGNGIPGGSCTVSAKTDATRTISCDDGTSVTISDGVPGKDGTACSVTGNTDGTKTVSCDDGTTATISDGAPGKDGTACSVTANTDGTKTVSCDDGTTVTISDGTPGKDGTSCSVADNTDGTKTVSCDDGTTVTISDGAPGKDGTSCSVTDHGDGTATITCGDGTSATLGGAASVEHGYANIKDFGAVGDGVADDTDEIQAALNSGAKLVYVPSGNYRITSTIRLSWSGLSLVGASRTGSILNADFRGGAVIEVTQGRCRIADLTLSSPLGSSRRNASPFDKPAPDPSVDGKSTDRGINLVEDGQLTYTNISRVDIVFQPGDGIAMGGAGSGTTIEQVGISYCGGHGMYFDDGDRDGTAKPMRNGIVTVRNSVIQKCWGHGVALATEAQRTVFRFNLENLDIFQVCLGDGGISQPEFLNSIKAAIAARAENLHIAQCGLTDVNGIQLSASTDVVVESTRFISVTNFGLIVNSRCSRVLVVNPFFLHPPTRGFRVNVLCDNIRVEGVDSSEFASETAIIEADSETVLTVNGKRCRTVAGSNVLWHDEEMKQSIVSSGHLNVQSNIVDVVGEGDVTDSISYFRFQGTIQVPDGYTFTVLNRNGYNISISSGGNIDTQGTTMVLETGECGSFISQGGTYYAVGRGVP